jgi:hypothetical protein
MEPLVFGYGRGAMDGFPMDPELPLDIVPVDTSINAILAALAATAGRPGVHVFQIGTSHCNPLGTVSSRHVGPHLRSRPSCPLPNNSVVHSHRLHSLAAYSCLQSLILNRPTGN